MRKSTLYLLIAVAVALAAGIAAAVIFLYSDSGKKETVKDAAGVTERHELIEAVPSDAAIVICVKNFGRALELLSDTTTVFRGLTSGKFDNISRESFDKLRKAPAVISIHYSKDMPPLLAVRTGEEAADSTWNESARLKAAADSSGLFHKVSGDLLLISSSETIVNSSARHLSEGHSVQEAKGFSEIASQAPGSDIVFISNAYSDNIIDTFLARKYRRFGGFFREIAGWTAFSLTRHSTSGMSMDGTLLYGSDPSFYLNVTRHSGAGPVGIADAVPSYTYFIIDLPIGNISSYLKAYRNHLDSKARLDKYEATLSRQRKESGQSAEDWAKSLNIKEVAIVGLHFGGSLRQLLFIKPGNGKAEGDVKDFSPFEGFAKTIFGDIFTAGDETASVTAGGWIVAGPRDIVDEYSQMSFETLEERLSACGLSDRIPQKGCGFWFYHSIAEDPNLISSCFSPSTAKAVRDMVSGSGYVPVTLSAAPKGEKMGLSLDISRADLPAGATSIRIARDTNLSLPSPEFKVRNSSTGKINTLYQNSHLSICFKDENGKDQWGIPFKSPILGYVKEIDYFGNDKIQYLFAAGSKLYLIDRLGRFAGGFPIDLGKGIALGPELYDFPPEKERVVMVLHKDNTVGLYNLRGEPDPDWKGITTDETIKQLPEPLAGEGKRYWVVRTSRQAFVCPFEGGEPLIIGEGKRMIRPDSEIRINEKGNFTAVCHDGKERTFKPGKEKR